MREAVAGRVELIVPANRSRCLGAAGGTGTDYVVTVLSAAQVYNYLDFDYPTLSGYCYGGCRKRFSPVSTVEDSRRCGDRLHRREHEDDRRRRHGFHTPFSRSHWAERLLGELVASRHASFGADSSVPLGVLVPSNLDRVLSWTWNRPFSRWTPTSSYSATSRSGGDGRCPIRGDADLRRRARVAPVLPVHRGVGEVGHHGRLRPGKLLPRAPLTRGQMATFLAKALGLHWPN